MTPIIIIPQGEEAKMRITIDQADMQHDDFTVSIVYGYRREHIDIPKQDMLRDRLGRYYFTFATDDITGQVVAECRWREPDADCPDGLRDMVDRQLLCFVAATPSPRLLCMEGDDREHRVSYEPIADGDLSAYVYLLDCDGRRIATSDDKYLMIKQTANDMEQLEDYRLRQTGDEVQQILDKSTEQVKATLVDDTLIIVEE